MDRLSLFLVGCPRSGTTWLQSLLGSHPQVATMPETHLYTSYVRLLDEAYRRDVGAPHAAHGVGVAAQIPRTAFAVLTGAYVTSLLDHLADGPDAAAVVLEKTPQHALTIDLIDELQPDARFIHLVRDPRAVVASLLAASRGWGAHWAPGDAAGATRYWIEHMEAARRVEALGARGRTVRYEDLHADGAVTLGALFAWLGLEASPEACQQALDGHALERVRSAPPATAPQVNAPDFYRRGTVAGWRDELDPADVAAIEHEAWAPMRALGYEPVHAARPPGPAPPPKRPGRRLRREVGRFLVRMGRRVGGG